MTDKANVCIITPSIANQKLKDCSLSVINQTYENINHLVIADGRHLIYDIEQIYSNPNNKKTFFETLTWNTGKNGFYGHRIYGAYSMLVPHDYIIFLDEDNWIKPNHVESLVSLIEEKNLDWAYSLRSIYDGNQNYLCDDNGESLGKYQGAVDYKFVDTSCYCIKREVAAKCASAWYHGWGGDRKFYDMISYMYPKFDTTGEHTLCYRLDGNPNSPKKEFFESANQFTLKKYNGKLPWIKN